MNRDERGDTLVGKAWYEANRGGRDPETLEAVEQEALETPGWPICPRCAKRPLEPWGGSLSRTDNETEICGICGTDEAMRDYRGEPLAPPKEWPVA